MTIPVTTVRARAGRAAAAAVRNRNRRRAAVLSALLASYVLLEAASIGVLPAQRLVAVALLGWVSLWAIASARKRLIPAFGVFLPLFVASSIPSLLDGRTISFRYFPSDAALLLLPFITYLVGTRVLAGMSRRSMLLLTAVAAAAALLGPVAASASGRHEAPELLLIGLTTYWFATSRRAVARALALAAVPVWIYLSLSSGFRSVFVLHVVGALLMVVLVQRRRGRYRLAVLLVLAGGILVAFLGLRFGSFATSLLDQSAGGSRIALLFEQPVADNAASRVDEATAALRTWNESQSPLVYIFGFGPGSTYYYDATGSLRHDIHIGPILAVFRYGAVGLIAYLLLLVRLCATAYRAIGTLSKPKVARREDLVGAAFAIAAGFYAVDFFVRTQLANPAFSIAVGLSLAWSSSRARAARSTAEGT